MADDDRFPGVPYDEVFDEHGELLEPAPLEEQLTAREQPGLDDSEDPGD